MDFGGLIDHLVHGQCDEVAEHDVDYRTQSGHGGTYGESGETGFGDWRVEHAVFAEFFQQAGKYFKWRACFGDVLAHDADGGVAAHLFGQCLTNCLRERYFTNGCLRHTRPRPLHRRSGMEPSPRNQLLSSSQLQVRFALAPARLHWRSFARPATSRNSRSDPSRPSTIVLHASGGSTRD